MAYVVIPVYLLLLLLLLISFFQRGSEVMMTILSFESCFRHFLVLFSFFVR